MSFRNRVYALMGFLGVLCLAFFLRQRGISLSVDHIPPRLPNAGWNAGYKTEEYGDDVVYLVIGIQLGNDYSHVGVLMEGAFVLVANELGDTRTPNYVAFTGQGPLIGTKAMEQANMNSENTIYDFRRLLGRKFSDPSFQEEIKALPYKVTDDGDRPRVRVQVDGAVKFYEPEEITAEVLKRLKTVAENHLRREVRHAVISVPAHFNDIQRQATKDAAEIAGLNALRLINEPTAAGIAYDIDKMRPFERTRRVRKHYTNDIIHDSGRIAKESTRHCTGIDDEYCFLVFNIEERNCEVTLMEVDSEVFELLSTTSSHFGGQDFDQDLLAYATDQFRANKMLELSERFVDIERLHLEVKKAEEKLLTDSLARIEIQSRDGTSRFFTTVTEDMLQDLHSNSFAKVLALVEQLLTDVNLDESFIDGLILTGDPLYVAKIQPVIEAYFDSAKLYSGLKSDEIVAQGVAVQARVLGGDWPDQLCTLTIGPYVQLSLGVETAGGLLQKVIRRNYLLPTRAKVVLSTATDNQEKIVLKIYQGERAMANDNQLLGTLELDGLPKKRIGEVEIEVMFEMDPDFGLTVVAKDKAGKREAKVVFDRGNLGSEREEEVEDLIREAEKFMEEDLRRVAVARENRWKGNDRFGVALSDED